MRRRSETMAMVHDVKEALIDARNGLTAVFAAIALLMLWRRRARGTLRG